jgi:cobalt transporter subunit CbtB
MKGIRMSTLIKSASLPAAQQEAVRYGVLALLVGTIFIGVAGFAPIDAIHDAAHNTRHAIAFPCH